MRSGTAGQIAVSQILPPDIAVDVKELDKPGIAAAMDAVATKYPERYRDITKQLMDLGRVTAYRAGGYSFDLNDLSPGQSTLAARARIRESIAAALDEPDRAKRRAQIDGAVDLERDRLTKDLMAESVAANNPFGMQVLSGSRGNPNNLRSLRGFDGAYEDHHGTRIPLPILQNYSEGLPAASYFAGTFGARKGVLDVKACLSGDTLVLMADFSSRRIADIEPGMLVFGADANGCMRPVRVVRRYDNGTRRCIRVTVATETLGAVTLVATEDHKVLSRNGQLLPLRALILQNLGVYRTDAAGYGFVASMEQAGEIPTFDLEVDHPDHMFVLANGLVVSNSTADAGYAAKQLIQGTHRLIVTDLDDDEDPDNVNVRGMPTRTDDNENVGSLLAVAAGGYPRNTELTPKILAELRRTGVDDILVRSPIVGGPADGGVYARDTGMRERGGLAPRGDFIGHAAGQAVSEKLTQMQLNSKHSGGVAGAGPAGFPLINQLMQVPEAFRGGSAHAQADGTVGAPKTAPQGGYYIDIGGKEHYVNPEQTLLFKPGDTVEAGDVLTTGIPNPAQIVQHKGIGEGRRYFVDALRGALKQSGTHVARRNLEVLGRGLINHVRMTDLVDDYAPDDIVPYHTIERNWQPRPGAVTVAPSAAVGQYLERPTLHYTIGTRITKNMVPKLTQFGVNTLTAHRDPPPFEPEMQRAAAAVSTDPDWQVRMLGSGQKGSLLDAAHRGASSDEAGTSFVPAMIRGENFGVVGPTTGR